MATRVLQLHLADTVDKWRALGFTIEKNVLSLSNGLQLVFHDTCKERRGLFAWTLSDSQSVEGISSLPPSTSSTTHSTSQVSHANTVTHVDHVVIVTPDIPHILPALTGAGLSLRRQATVKGLPMAFLVAGITLEVVQLPESRTHLWGLTFVCSSVTEAQQCVSPHAGSLRPAFQGKGRRIFTVQPSAGLSTHVAFMSLPSHASL